MTAEQEKTYCSVAEAARYLGVSEATIRRWIKQQRLPAYRVGPKTIRIKRTDLEAMLVQARSRNDVAALAEDKRDRLRKQRAARQSNSIQAEGQASVSETPAHTARSLRDLAGLPPLSKEQEDYWTKVRADLATEAITPEEMTRRRALYEQIMANRKTRDISPLTVANLIRISREENGGAYD